jgi:hypothetical protein
VRGSRDGEDDRQDSESAHSSINPSSFRALRRPRPRAVAAPPAHRSAPRRRPPAPTRGTIHAGVEGRAGSAPARPRPAGRRVGGPAFAGVGVAAASTGSALVAAPPSPPEPPPGQREHQRAEADHRDRRAADPQPTPPIAGRPGARSSRRHPRSSSSGSRRWSPTAMWWWLPVECTPPRAPSIRTTSAAVCGTLVGSLGQEPRDQLLGGQGRVGARTAAGPAPRRIDARRAPPRRQPRRRAAARSSSRTARSRASTGPRGDRPCRPPAHCSGAIYDGVPRTAPVRVCDQLSLATSLSLAMPKSRSFTRSPLATSESGTRKMLSGLMSRWTMPRGVGRPQRRRDAAGDREGPRSRGACRAR